MKAQEQSKWRSLANHTKMHANSLFLVKSLYFKTILDAEIVVFLDIPSTLRVLTSYISVPHLLCAVSQHYHELKLIIYSYFFVLIWCPFSLLGSYPEHQIPSHRLGMSPETPPSCDSFSEGARSNGPDSCGEQGRLSHKMACS